MKKITLSILALAVLFLSGCTKPMDKPINSEDFEKVKEEINADVNYSKMKKKYIIDNLSEELGFLELGKGMAKAMGEDFKKAKIPTFREEVQKLTVAFDSIRAAKVKITEDNKKLKNFISVTDASTTPIDKYKGYLNMTLNFDNQFDKEILYIILSYKYVNKYDSEFFSEKSKLTDEIAGNFKGEVKISTKEEYNDAAEFMYTKVPVKASKALRNELGTEKADKKVERDFLLEGLKVETLGIVFKDKSELLEQDAEWEYLE